MQHGEPMTVEIGVPYKRYHAVAVHSGHFGEPPPELRALYNALRDGIEAGLEMIRPGQPAAEVATTIVDRLESEGLSRRGRHVGYGIGIGYPPTWLDNLRIKSTDAHVLAPGMTFFLFAGALTKRGAECLYLGEPVAVSRDGCERLSSLPRELRVL
jgi:Xaa-Pro aminopeptidase